MPHAAGAHYTQSPDAATTSVGDRVVLYHRVSRTALVLNPTASRLWDQLVVGRTPTDLAGALREQYPSLPPDQATRDVEALLAELSQHAFVFVRT